MIGVIRFFNRLACRAVAGLVKARSTKAEGEAGSRRGKLGWNHRSNQNRNQNNGEVTDKRG